MANSNVKYEQVDDNYLQERKLKRGAAGWVLLAGLGVSYVISGEFAGWNFGLEQGGFGGMLIATFIMGTMYTCMVFLPLRSCLLVYLLQAEVIASLDARSVLPAAL